MSGLSMFAGGRSSANAFPHYTTRELERDLASGLCDPDTAERIKAEISRRASAQARRRMGLTPCKRQAERGRA